MCTFVEGVTIFKGLSRESSHVPFYNDGGWQNKYYSHFVVKTWRYGSCYCTYPSGLGSRHSLGAFSHWKGENQVCPPKSHSSEGLEVLCVCTKYCVNGALFLFSVSLFSYKVMTFYCYGRNYIKLLTKFIESTEFQNTTTYIFPASKTFGERKNTHTRILTSSTVGGRWGWPWRRAYFFWPSV